MAASCRRSPGGRHHRHQREDHGHHPGHRHPAGLRAPRRGRRQHRPAHDRGGHRRVRDRGGGGVVLPAAVHRHVPPRGELLAQPGPGSSRLASDPRPLRRGQGPDLGQPGCRGHRRVQRRRSGRRRGRGADPGGGRPGEFRVASRPRTGWTATGWSVRTTPPSSRSPDCRAPCRTTWPTPWPPRPWPPRPAPPPPLAGTGWRLPPRRRTGSAWSGRGTAWRWYDDSKATTPASVLAAVAGFSSVVLIAGGRNKGLDLAALRATVPPVRAVVAIGEAAGDVGAAFAGLAPVTTATSMDAAVDAAARLAIDGDAVLLSPGAPASTGTRPMPPVVTILPRSCNASSAEEETSADPRTACGFDRRRGATRRRGWADPTPPQPRPAGHMGTFWVLVVLVAILCLIGVVMVLSASSIVSLQQFGSPWYFFERQLMWLAIGTVGFLVARRVDPERGAAWRRWPCTSPSACCSRCWSPASACAPPERRGGSAPRVCSCSPPSWPSWP